MSPLKTLMQQHLQAELIRELLTLEQQRAYPLSNECHTAACEQYTDPTRFEQELERLFKRSPQVVALSSELPQVGDFVTRHVLGMPLLITRSSPHEVHAFINVCRHRGAQLVAASAGCQSAFACPYHAWTWSNRGDLLRARLQDHAFPDLKVQDQGLYALTCVESAGLIWVTLAGGSPAQTEQFIRPLSPELASWGFADLRVQCSDTVDVAANWKLIVEGGIESYHFKVAHRQTIGPHFLDSLSTYRVLGQHLRSILPRASLSRLRDQDPARWRLREHANILYNVFPATQFLLMPDHVAWVQTQPLAVDQTRITLTTLAPDDSEDPTTIAHWQTNQGITRATLMEDFALNASTQAGLHTPANTSLQFGRLEGALHEFNQLVARQLDA